MWFTKTQDEVLKEIQTEPTLGLTTEEANVRLEKNGNNNLKGKPKKGFLSLFLSQLRDMLIYILLAVVVITAILGHWIDSLIILMVVFINATIGVIQEYKAEKAIEALEQLTTPRSLVRRDGSIKEISSEDLVVGDIVVLDAGRYVPADLRLIETANLQIEESALTGESVPSEKKASDLHKDLNTPVGDRSNMAFMSTLTTYGRGEGVAVATAMDTEMRIFPKR